MHLINYRVEYRQGKLNIDKIIWSSRVLLLLSFVNVCVLLMLILSFISWRQMLFSVHWCTSLHSPSESSCPRHEKKEFAPEIISQQFTEVGEAKEMAGHLQQLNSTSATTYWRQVQTLHTLTCEVFEEMFVSWENTGKLGTGCFFVFCRGTVMNFRTEKSY